ncbi:MAG: AAA family ATPase [Proteobacteria bacterium]|nr:AAA family ATPase [Pseudomonadota bacterium]
MKIKNISLDNFRCFERLNLDLQSRVNLFIGNNGSGKSAVLDALSIGLGVIATHLPGISGISFKKKDLRRVRNQDAPYTRVALETSDGIRWDVTRKRDKSEFTASLPPPAKGKKALTTFLNADVIDPHNNQDSFELPFFAYYGVSRAILDIPLHRRGFQKKQSRFDSLAGSLDAVSRFRSAFIWFYNKENEEGRLQKDKKSFDLTLKELDVARTALAKVFPDLTEPHIEVNPLRFMIKKNGHSFSLDQLSDGYKTMLGLILDLSSRMAMANPEHDNPLESEAIVMVDEIDLHLHPSWQQRVIGDLIRTFPNTQFILTTHSPYVVESVNNHLKREKIKGLPIANRVIENIEPLSPHQAGAYLLKDDQLSDIMNHELGLIDDKLITHFNEINMLYDKMRDIEWEAKRD